MTRHSRVLVFACAGFVPLVLLPGAPAGAQTNGTPRARPADDTVVVQASRRYGASGVHRFLLGDTYRDLWSKPIRVPLLDLGRYAGGLTPLEEGGNAQTRNLHLRGADGREYVFRPILKEVLQLPDDFKGTVVEDVFADGLSASHPAATVIPTPFLKAARVLHASPVLYVMPDNKRLGEFRANFAGKLGTMEQFPEDPENGRGFGGAVDIIDSDDLLEELNEDPTTRVDAHALLTARLTDLVIGDNDRHPGQWKWARLRKSPDARWIPIPRDRDKAFVSYEGALLSVARVALPRLVTYGDRHATALFRTAADFDRRLLVQLQRADFDSTARALQRAFTDSVIAAAMAAMPPEYRRDRPDLELTLRSRRDDLPRAADRYYRTLFAISEVHGTDENERATIVRHPDGAVDVQLSAAGRPYFSRRFAATDTREIRVYLQGGDDTAVVRGPVRSGVTVRILGGAGRNVMADSPTRPGANTPLYQMDGIDRAAPDKELLEDAGYDPDSAWLRRPITMVFGQPSPPVRDYGRSQQPVVGVSTGHGLGVVLSAGYRWRTSGFERYPYATSRKLEVGYSTTLRAWEVELTTDDRFEQSRLFLQTESAMSQLETGYFGGFGNDVALPDDLLLDVRQTQWLFRPALGWAMGPASEITIGPMVKLTRTDSLAGTVAAADRPYGFRRFGQAGLVMRLLHESTWPDGDGSFADKIMQKDPARGFTLEADAAFYPAVWDAKSAFGSISGVASGHVTLPILLRPVFAVRAGAKRVFGEFPFYESAFLGGSQSLRSVRRQRYAGDAAVYGTAELRIPVATFPLVLPLNTGVIGFADVGRVYHDGSSPGGWHSGVGGGIWIGVLKPSTSLTVTFTNSRERRMIFGTGFVF